MTKFEHANHRVEFVTRNRHHPHQIIINDLVALETMQYDKARERFEKAVNRALVGGYASI